MSNLSVIQVYDRLVREGCEVGGFGTAGTGKLSRAIRRVTVGSYSHVGIAFYPGNMRHNGDFYYWEALAGQGFLGPRYGAELLDWVHREKERKLTIVKLTGTPTARVFTMLGKTLGFGESVTYGELQLLAFYFFKKLHIPIRKSLRTVICSEITGRVFYPWADIPASMEVPSMDALSPQDVMDFLMSYYQKEVIFNNVEE